MAGVRLHLTSRHGQGEPLLSRGVCYDGTMIHSERFVKDRALEIPMGMSNELGQCGLRENEQGLEW